MALRFNERPGDVAARDHTDQLIVHGHKLDYLIELLRPISNLAQRHIADLAQRRIVDLEEPARRIDPAATEAAKQVESTPAKPLESEPMFGLAPKPASAAAAAPEGRNASMAAESQREQKSREENVFHRDVQSKD